MKSLVSFPVDFENILFPQNSDRLTSGRLVVHYELLKKVKHLKGSIIKCGVSANEGFSRFSIFKNVLASNSHKMIAFEKCSHTFSGNETQLLQEPINVVNYQHLSVSAEKNQNSLIEQGLKEKVDFVPGDISDAIPDYLIENPELRIAYLNIDLDDYEATLCTLDFFYPRLVQGGILVFDNFHKKQGEYKAVAEYFRNQYVLINNFSMRRGPHYIIRD